MVELCLTLADQKIAGLQGKIDKFSGKVPIAEIRLDFLDSVDFPVLPHGTTTRFLATCRPLREGGRFNGPESERLEILRQAPAKGLSLIDVEFDVETLPEFSAPVKIVRSHHDFVGCPADLDLLYREMGQVRGDLVKLVVTPAGPRDVVRLLRFMEETLPGSPGIILGMGDASSVTRILGPFMGNAWTYVSAGDDGVAPGQFSLDLALNGYRLAEWRAVPNLYGVACKDSGNDLEELVKNLNAGLRILGSNSLVFPLPGMDVDVFLPYAESSRLPHCGIIELETGFAGEGLKLRRISLKKAKKEESRVYENLSEAVRDTLKYYMD